MIIKEGSKLKIYDNNDLTVPLIDEIIANQDIKIENSGKGYEILLRHERYSTNSIFECDRIEKISKDTYEIYGYFKDALLVVKSDNYNPAMYNSYMDA